MASTALEWCVDIVGGLLGCSTLAFAYLSYKDGQRVSRLSEIPAFSPGQHLLNTVKTREGYCLPYAAITGKVCPQARRVEARRGRDKRFVTFEGSNYLVVQTTSNRGDKQESSFARLCNWLFSTRAIETKCRMVPLSLEPIEDETGWLDRLNINIEATAEDVAPALVPVSEVTTQAKRKPREYLTEYWWKMHRRWRNHSSVTQVLTAGPILTVTGRVSLVNGQLEISAPFLPGNPFIISRLSVDELIQQFTQQRDRNRLFGIMCAVSFLGYCAVRYFINRRRERREQCDAAREPRPSIEAKLSAAKEKLDSDVASSDHENDDMCVVCLTEPCTITVLECGHHCSCARCALQLTKCPVCHGSITSTVHSDTSR